MATEADLAETVKEVEALDRRIVAAKADVRDPQALKAALDDGVAQLGRLDIVSRQRRASSSRAEPGGSRRGGPGRTMIDINLTGVWHTVKAALPHLSPAGRQRSS